MGRRGTNPGALLPVQTTTITKSLTGIYARLKGELIKAADGEDVLIESKAAKAYMRHIAALMPLLGAEFEPKEIKPWKSRLRSGPLGHGGMRTAALTLLKSNGG
jgi:hypothetical protein